MADKKISDFTEATTIASNDWLEIENAGGNSRKVSGANTAKAFNALVGYEGGPATPPTDADLATWDNQGTSTASDGTDVFILKPQCDGVLHGKIKAAPATPWTLYCRLEMNTLSSNNVGTGYSNGAGFWLKDTAGDNERLFLWIGQAHDAAGGDDTKTYGAHITRYNGASPPGGGSTVVSKYSQVPWRWLKLDNDGTTLTLSAGFDGKNWTQVGTETLAAHIDGAASFGVAAFGTAAATEVAAIFSYFSTTAPS